MQDPITTSWAQLMTPENIGRSWILPATRTKGAYRAAIANGLRVKSHKRDDGSVEITLLPRDPARLLKPHRQEIAEAQARDNDIPHRLAEAREYLAYWTREKTHRTTNTGRAEAGARVLIWEAQVKKLSSMLQPA